MPSEPTTFHIAVQLFKLSKFNHRFPHFSGFINIRYQIWLTNNILVFHEVIDFFSASNLSPNF